MLCGIDIVYLCIIIFMYLCICFFCVLVHLCIYAFVHLYFIVVDLAVHYQDCGRQWEMLSGKESASCCTWEGPGGEGPGRLGAKDKKSGCSTSLLTPFWHSPANGQPHCKYCLQSSFRSDQCLWWCRGSCNFGTVVCVFILILILLLT